MRRCACPHPTSDLIHAYSENPERLSGPLRITPTGWSRQRAARCRILRAICCAVSAAGSAGRATAAAARTQYL